MNILVFDIETVPDLANGRKIYELSADLPDSEVLQAMQAARLNQTQGNSDFIQQHLQQIVCISVVLHTPNQFTICSIGDEDSSEADIIQRFYAGIDKYQPDLVSWNGAGFDLPVLHYRSMLHGVAAAQYWETGDRDSSFRYNNYLNRYHYRHLDLMDVLAQYNLRSAAPLDHIAQMLNLPGKIGVGGAQVASTYFAGDLKAIRDYCEIDVLNTYLVYLRFELIRGKLNPETYASEIKSVRNYLAEAEGAHFQQYLSEWKND